MLPPAAACSVAILLAPLAACAAQAPVSPAPLATIPFEYDGHIFLHGTVNGDSARLLYDPVDGVILDRRFADRGTLRHRDWRGVGDGGPTRVGGGGGDQVEVTWADSVTLALGGLQWRFPRIPVIPLDSMMGDAIAGTPDGLAGTTLFRDHAVHLDFAARRMELYAPGSIDTTGWQVLPVTVIGAKGVVPLRMTVGDTVEYAMRAVVDIGMAGAFRVSTREVDARNLLRHAARNLATGRGLGGMLLSRRLGNVRVHLGAVATDPIEVELAREPRGADANPRDYDALLGLGVLSRFDVIYDLGNGRLLVRPLG